MSYSEKALKIFNAILEENAYLEQAKTSDVFDSSINIEEYDDKKLKLTELWKTSEKSLYNGKIEEFFKIKGLPDNTTPEFRASKNLSRIKKEVKKRIESGDKLKIIDLDAGTNHRELLNIAESLENPDELKNIYKIRKMTTGDGRGSGINTEESERLRSCLRQGRELFLSGRNGDLMAKPLNFFYSVTAYSFAITILNNPIRFTLDSFPGSHGVNFVLDSMTVQFGGGASLGTFSELFTAFPTATVRGKDFEIIQDLTNSITAFYNSKITCSTGMLLSMIPEIRQYYRIISNNKGRTHPVSIEKSKPHAWTFVIGDGEVRPDTNDVERAFPECKIEDKYGQLYVTVPLQVMPYIKASLYVDARGFLWYIENPFFPVILPNFCVGFLLNNIFSNVMRYSPDKWGGILLNEANHDCSLIVRSFLSSFEQNFMVSMLRNTSRFYPILE